MSFVDCPGHEVLMGTMLAGTSIMDSAILTVSANETCPQPQTKEHLAAIELMKLNKLLILQNKIDLVTSQGASENYKEILQFTKNTTAEGSPIIPISAEKKYNIDVVLESLVNTIPIPTRSFLTPPRLIVVRSFDVNRPKTVDIGEIKGGVAGGSISQGVLRLGDKIEIRPGIITSDNSGGFNVSTINTTVQSLFAESNQLSYAVPGGLIGVGTNVDPSICRANRLVGQVLGKEGTLPDVFIEIEMSFHLLSNLLGIKEQNKNVKVRKIKKSEVLMLTIGSTSVGGVVNAVRKDLAILKLSKPVCCSVNDKLAISRKINLNFRLIGWGNILCGKKIVSGENQY